MLKQVVLCLRSSHHHPAAFRRLCVETNLKPEDFVPTLASRRQAAVC